MGAQYPDYSFAVMDKYGNYKTVTHKSPHVTTHFDMMSLRWFVRATCCGIKYQLAITEELLAEASPEYISGLIYHEFKKQVGDHPPLKDMLKAVAKGKPGYHSAQPLVKNVQSDGTSVLHYGNAGEYWDYNFDSKDKKTYEQVYLDELKKQNTFVPPPKPKTVTDLVGKSDNFKKIAEFQKKKKALATAIGMTGGYELVSKPGGVYVVRSDGQQVAFSSLWQAKDFLSSISKDLSYAAGDFGHDLEMNSWIEAPKWATGGGQAMDPAVEKLPGLDAEVKHPISGKMIEIMDCVISLNDTHKWTREQIADWLETLDVDLRFK